MRKRKLNYTAKQLNRLKSATSASSLILYLKKESGEQEKDKMVDFFHY